MARNPEHLELARASNLATEIRALFGKLKRRLREQASFAELTPSQISVLLRLEREGPNTTSGLARLEGMRPQSMGSVIAALQDAGLVSSTPDAADRRRSLLSLTPACRKWAEEGRAARQDWLTKTLRARFSRAEQDRIAEAIALLNRLVVD